MLSPSEQKLLNKVHESEHLIQQLGILIPDIIYVLDLHRKQFTFINNRVTEVMAPDNLLLDKIHPADSAPRNLHIEQCMQLLPNQTLDIEIRLLTKDGKWNWFQVRDTAYRSDKNGATTHTIGIVRNIQPEKDQHEALVNKESILKGIFNSQVISLVIYKAIRNHYDYITDFEFLATSKCFDQFHGRSDLQGKLLFSEFPTFKPSVADTWRKIINEDIVVSQKANYPHPQTGKQHSFFLRYEKFGDGLMATYDDITVNSKIAV